MEFGTRVQALDKAVCFLFRANIFGKISNPSMPIVEQMSSLALVDNKSHVKYTNIREIYWYVEGSHA